MKTKSIVLGIIITIGLISCSGEEIDGVKVQAHDDNAMMDKMHTMMSQMESMPMTNDPDLDFANMMIMHHQGAIEMANLELQEGSNAEMQSIAQSIITEQQQEIQKLQQILQGLSDDNDDMPFSMELMMSMDKMGTVADTQLLTGNTDHDFAALMIAHHQAAIDNASAYLHHGSDTELRTMANMIIEMQNKEIIKLGKWLINN